MAATSLKNKTKSGSLLVGNSAYIPPLSSVEVLVVAGGGSGATEIGRAHV